MKTTRVHCQVSRYTKYIGRPRAGQPWGFGNPFVIGPDGTRDEVIDKFDKWLETGENFGNADAAESRRKWILYNIHTIKFEVLGCWCFEGQRCHGDVLIERSERE